MTQPVGQNDWQTLRDNSIGAFFCCIGSAMLIKTSVEEPNFVTPIVAVIAARVGCCCLVKVAEVGIRMLGARGKKGVVVE